MIQAEELRRSGQEIGSYICSCSFDRIYPFLKRQLQLMINRRITAPPLHFRWKCHRGYQLPMRYRNPTIPNMSARLRNTENQPGCFIYSTPLIGTTLNLPLLSFTVAFRRSRDTGLNNHYISTIYSLEIPVFPTEKR